MTTKVRCVLQWIAAGNDLMSPDMARVAGLTHEQRRSMIKYVRVRKYVEWVGPLQYRLTELGKAAAVHVHKTDEQVLARQRKSYRRRVKARDATEKVVAHARRNVANSVFAWGAQA